MATIHISEAEAMNDLAGLLVRVREGADVVIDGVLPAVRLSVVTSSGGRLLSESIALAVAHAQESRVEPAMDAGFAADMEEVLRNRKPRDTSAWD